MTSWEAWLEYYTFGGAWRKEYYFELWLTLINPRFPKIMGEGTSELPPVQNPQPSHPP